MNVSSLAIPLTGLFDLTNLCASATACRPCFVLNTSTNGQPLFMGDSGLFLQHVTALLSQGIEVALVIINDGLVETALQFFQCHASRLRRCFGIVDAVRRVGKSLFKTFRHPTKESFDGSLRAWAIRRCLL